MKSLLFLAIIFISVGTFTHSALAEGNDSQIKRGPALSIVDLGVGTDGERRLNVQTDAAEIADVLKAVFKLTGDDFAIDQDVVGSVDIKLKNVTPDVVLKQIAETAKPALKILRVGNLYKISRDPALAKPTEGGAGAAGFDPLKPYAGAGNPIGYQQVAAGNRPVNLDVPKDRPITMAEAFSRISSQSGINIRLDRRVPRDLTFSGTIISAPASLVLQTIAHEADLKLIPDASGITVAPTDQFTIRMNELLYSEYPNSVCRSCGAKVSPLFRFCPNCGRVTGRGMKIISPPGIVPTRQGPGSRK